MLDKPLGDIPGIVRAKRPQKLPVVLSVDEVAQVCWGMFRAFTG